MKKLVSLFLALALILSLHVTAFATNLTINDTGKTYNGYQLLTLTTSLKCDHEEDAAHADSCYNYAYSVNEKYQEILQAQAGAEDIIAYLSTLSSDTSSGYGTLRDAADRIYRAIKNAENIAPDKTGLTGTATIDQGYWLFADVSELTGNAANSLVIVDTAGQTDLTINPKTDLPIIEKKVMDTNDTTGATTDWQDSADYDIGDSVPFKLNATLPSNVAYYDSYKIAFHDTLSSGLTLKPDSVKVYMFASAADAEADSDFTDNTPVSGFTTSMSELKDDCTFEVTCGNVLEISGVTKDSVFVVYYEATLDNDATIGAAGNPNEVYLEFSNNPYSNGTGNTEPDKVIVFTYQLTINKVDSDNQPLAGAAFTLYKQTATGSYAPVGSALTGAGDNLNNFEWKGLDDGNYKLVESTVPAGYNKMNDIEFAISAEHDEESDTPRLTNLTSTLGTVQIENGVLTGVITDDIVNQTGTVLPETGARGTAMLIAISSMFVMVADVFMVTRKKMSIYED